MMNSFQLPPHIMDLGNRLVLKIMTKKDAYELFNLIIIDDVRSNIDAFSTIASITDAEELIDAFSESYQEGNGIMWGVFKEEHFVGVIGLCDLSFEPIVFYAMDTKWRMQGIMKQCVEKVTTCVRNLGYSSIKTQVHPDNIASKRVLVRCGYNYFEDDDCYHHYLSLRSNMT